METSQCSLFPRNREGFEGNKGAPGMGLEPMRAVKAHQLSSHIRYDLEADAFCDGL